MAVIDFWPDLTLKSVSHLLGGLVTGPKVCGSKLGDGDGFSA
jgi:hypothetical protein